MPKATFHFPPGFLWGTATSSHQVEGNNKNNNWYAWEQDEGRIIHGHKSGLACDWWGGRWKQDFDRAAEAGQNAHRLSIEWSRVQPTPDQWDEDALDHYREIVRGLYVRKMTPLITLHHFSDPLWLVNEGGWENPEAPQKFARFVRKVVEALKDYATLWVTINEPNLYTYFGYVEGTFPPGKKDLGAAFRVGTNLVRGHAAAYREIHDVQVEARVGVAHHYRGFKPEDSLLPFNAWMTRFLSSNLNDAFPRVLVNGRFRFLGKQTLLREAIDTQDYFGINYYTVDLIRFAPLAVKEFFNKRRYPPDAELSGTGFIANVPDGMTMAIRWAQAYGKPMLILENGVEDADDTLRPRYLLEHLHKIWHQVNENVQIKGYFHWSLVDNFEWERGWTQRFGLWGLNPDTQVRTRRPSVDLFAAICKENSISSAMVEKFAPAIFDQMFPV
jgi:beta-glucosidase